MKIYEKTIEKHYSNMVNDSQAFQQKVLP